MDSEDEELALLCVLLDEDKLDKKKGNFGFDIFTEKEMNLAHLKLLFEN